MIRPATAEDAKAILAIYSPYILNTSLTFEADVPTTASFAQRISSYQADWPWLVYEDDGKIAGYAYGSRYRERVGYQWCVECSIYLDEACHGKSIAKKIYNALFRLLKIQGYRNVYAVINLPNPRSVRFHESCGFTWFASYENVGFKLGQWKTVGWWKLTINEYDDHPLAPIRFSELPPQTVDEIIAAVNEPNDAAST